MRFVHGRSIYVCMPRFVTKYRVHRYTGHCVQSDYKIINYTECCKLQLFCLAVLVLKTIFLLFRFGFWFGAMCVCSVYSIHGCTSGYVHFALERDIYINIYIQIHVCTRYAVCVYTRCYIRAYIRGGGEGTTAEKHYKRWKKGQYDCEEKKDARARCVCVCVQCYTAYIRAHTHARGGANVVICSHTHTRTRGHTQQAAYTCITYTATCMYVYNSTYTPCRAAAAAVLCVCMSVCVGS